MSPTGSGVASGSTRCTVNRPRAVHRAGSGEYNPLISNLPFRRNQPAPATEPVADGPARAVVERRVGETEFVLLMALISALTALAIDMLLPGFSGMREAFGLAPDATDLAATITLFFIGNGIGNLVYGPMADAWGRKPVLVASLGLYGGAALAATLAPNLTVLLAARFVWGVGAGGPRVLTQAIVRDRFSGDAMARVMSMIQAAFFIGPIAAPLLGAGLVAIGSWRWVMAFGVLSALTTAIWSLRLQETLPPSRRRQFTPRAITGGVRAVLGHRTTLLFSLSLMFLSGAFFSFLSSSELIFDDVFGHGDWFVTYFSLMAVLLGCMSLGINRLLRRVSAGRITLAAGAGMIVFSAARVVLAQLTDGVPPFWVWVVLFSLSNVCVVAMFPSLNSLALEPMGDLAGTAASVVGFLTSVGGAVLATITDRRLGGTVAPLALGYLLYSVISYCCQLTALRRSATPVESIIPG